MKGSWYLFQRQRDWLREESYAQGVTESELLRRALDRTIPHPPPLKPPVTVAPTEGEALA